MMTKKALIISCFNWYKARLMPVREILISRGYDVSVLIANFEHVNLAPVKIRYPECRYIEVPEYKKNISIGRIRSHLVFAKKVKEWIDTNNPNLIYCQVPPNKVATYCADYKKKNPDIKFVIDIIDMWPESMPLGRVKYTPPAKIWKRWRDDAIKVADYVFTECDLYREKLKGILTPSKTSTLYLYKEQSEEEKQLVRDIINRGKADDVIRFAYLGSMNNIIDIEGITSIIQSFVKSGYRCELHAIGDGESRDKFEENVKSVGCKTHFYGRVFEEMEKIKILAPCDYAFNMMKGDIAVGLTIKSIDYLSYGLPLINNIKGDTWRFVNSSKIGSNIATNDACSVAHFINRDTIHNFFFDYLSRKVFIECVDNAFNRIEVI